MSYSPTGVITSFAFNSPVAEPDFTAPSEASLHSSSASRPSIRPPAGAIPIVAPHPLRDVIDAVVRRKKEEVITNHLDVYFFPLFCDEVCKDQGFSDFSVKVFR